MSKLKAERKLNWNDVVVWNLKTYPSHIPSLTRPHLLQLGHTSYSFRNRSTNWWPNIQTSELKWAVISFKPPHKAKHSMKETSSFQYKISHQILYEAAGIVSLLKEKLGKKSHPFPRMLDMTGLPPCNLACFSSWFDFQSLVGKW